MSYDLGLNLFPLPVETEEANKMKRSTHVAGTASALLIALTLAVMSGSIVGPPAGGSSGQAPSVIAAPVQVVQTTDGAVGYRSVGHGSPLVLIMGYSGSMDTWAPSFIDALARRYKVVIFDNAGIGSTTLPPGTLTISSMADQTAALIAALKLGRPDVLGWSMGGMIAQALAVLHPNLVSHLVLAATLPGDGKAVPPSGSAVTALQSPGAANAGQLLTLLFPSNRSADRAAYLKAITSFPDFYLAPTPVDALQFKTLDEWISGQDPAGNGISHLKMPVLVADGTVDALIPVVNDHLLARAIPHAQLVLYPDASHAFWFQDQASFVGRLERFFG
jgi:pimeloyl-ACP methyl ester carboxylesterase